MLLNTLKRVAADTGYHPVQKRDVLIALLQQAADELYDELECSKMFREVTLVVPPNAVVSLPNFIGELRGMRINTNELPFELANIGQPRYTNNTLEHWYKNWRDKGESPIHTVLSAIGQLTIEVAQVETEPVTVYINGQTNLADRDEEQILIEHPSQTTTKQFGPGIYTIGCDSDSRTCDIVIKDVTGVEIAVLPSWSAECRYKIVDVSQIFWPLDTSDGQSLIDICYKVPKRRLERDSDTFYAGSDYDNTWYNKAMYLYCKPLQNRENDVAKFGAAVLQAVTAAKESGEGQQKKKLNYGRGKFMGLFNRYKIWPGAITNVDRTDGSTM